MTTWAGQDRQVFFTRRNVNFPNQKYPKDVCFLTVSSLLLNPPIQFSVLKQENSFLKTEQKVYLKIKWINFCNPKNPQLGFSRLTGHLDRSVINREIL